jgi:hypothetical protein
MEDLLVEEHDRLPDSDDRSTPGGTSGHEHPRRSDSESTGDPNHDGSDTGFCGTCVREDAATESCGTPDTAPDEREADGGPERDEHRGHRREIEITVRHRERERAGATGGRDE